MESADQSSEIVEEYKLTYLGEGNDDECETPHCPSNWSGVTFDHGIDLLWVNKIPKERTPLEKIKVEAVMSISRKKNIKDEIIEGCIGLKGDEAKDYIKKHFSKLKFSPEEQKLMFSKVIKAYIADTKFRFNERFSQEKIKFENLNPIFQKLLIDLCYVGNLFFKIKKSLELETPKTLKTKELTLALLKSYYENNSKIFYEEAIKWGDSKRKKLRKIEISCSPKQEGNNLVWKNASFEKVYEQQRKEKNLKLEKSAKTNDPKNPKRKKSQSDSDDEDIQVGSKGPPNDPPNDPPNGSNSSQKQPNLSGFSPALKKDLENEVDLLNKLIEEQEYIRVHNELVDFVNQYNKNNPKKIEISRKERPKTYDTTNYVHNGRDEIYNQETEIKYQLDMGSFNSRLDMKLDEYNSLKEQTRKKLKVTFQSFQSERIVTTIQYRTITVEYRTVML